MGTEFFGPCVKKDNMNISTIPPGFESLTPSSLKRLEDNQVTVSATMDCASETQTVQFETDLNSNDDLKTSKSFRHRSGVKYQLSDDCSGDESASEQHMFPRDGVQKGGICGCEEGSSCQKITAKWRPDEGRRPDLVEAPVFYPSEEEFEDTLKYISNIRPKAEMYGICRIVPPHSWKPPCPLKEKNIWVNSKFLTRVQRIEKLQNRGSMRKMLQVNYNKRKKKIKCMNTEVDYTTIDEAVKIKGEFELNETERFGFERGPEFTIHEFKKYADDFKARYFNKNGNSLDSGNSKDIFEGEWQPSVEGIEGEYWRMVEKPTEEIEVLYGADLETRVFGSGFPTISNGCDSDSYMKYINSGWNLNNFPRLPGSVLSFEKSDISGVLIPWLYIGMCFSSFCWHVEDHHFYSLNYMHWGDPKMWYGVPGSDAVKLEAAMRKHLPDLFEEQPDLLHKLVTQLSPSILKNEGVPVYRCVQNPGEFVLTFPRAYHAGFNCGFNCAEAVNVAPVDWLPHGQNVIEIYRKQGRKTSVSHDKLLLGAAREAVKATWEFNLLRKNTQNNLRWKDFCGKDGILSKALKNRVEVERHQRDFLGKSSQSLKMESSFDANSERECSICLFDLHLSAAGCHHCSPDKYACLNHAKQLCSCSWGAKFFLFRYDVCELNLLVEALEGKLSAIYKWARLDLGLVLSSYISKENMQNPGTVGKSSYTSQELAPKEITSPPIKVSSKEQKEEGRKSSNSINCIVSTNTRSKEKPSEVVLALESVKPSSNFSSSVKEASKHSFSCRKKNDSQSVLCFKVVKHQPSKVSFNSSMKKLPSKEPEGKHSSVEGDKLLNEVKEVIADKKPFPKNTEQQSGNVLEQVCPGDFVTVMSFTNPSSKSDITGCIRKCGRMKLDLSCQCMKVENQVVETNQNEGSQGSSHFKVPSIDTDLCENALAKNETSDCYKPKTCSSFEPDSNNENHCKRLKLGLDLVSNKSQTVPSNPHGSQNNLDRQYRRKGPRIAKVARGINCNAQPLSFGSVHAGKQWCDSQTIYPKGFRSRVKYIDVLNPTNICYYVSEILDVRRDRPLFMVYLEQCPTEIFVHVSAARCWEMVRQRVNQEIAKQHSLGREKLPPFQPPGSLNGLDMFGFSSPEIVQAIQAMDQNHICTDYWKSRPLLQSQSVSTFNPNSEAVDGKDIEKNPSRVLRILNSLFKKANPEELHTLNNLLLNENPADVQRLLTRLLDEEIHVASS